MPFDTEGLTLVEEPPKEEFVPVEAVDDSRTKKRAALVAEQAKLNSQPFGVPMAEMQDAIASGLIEGATEPFKKLPRPPISLEETGILPKKLAQGLGAAEEKVIGAVESLETPLGVGMMASGAVVPRVVAGVASLMGAGQAVQGAKEFSEGVKTGDAAKIGGGIADVALGGTFAGLTGHAALKEAVPVDVERVQPLAAETFKRVVEEPVRAEIPKEEEFKPVEQVEPPPASSTAPTLESEVKPSSGTGEVETTKGEPNAEQIESATTLGRSLLRNDEGRQASEGVPVAESSQGVRGNENQGPPAASEQTPQEVKTPAAPEPPPPDIPIEVAPKDLVPQLIGIKDAAVDAQRAERGLPPIMSAARKSDPVLWQQAMDAVAKESDMAQRLTRELLEKPRPLTDIETVVMERRLAELTNDLDQARYEGVKAADDELAARDLAREATDALGKQEASRLLDQAEAAKAQARTREAMHSAALTEVERAVGRGGAGTEQGRAFRARQLLMREDYSYAGIERRLRAAKDFEPLTAEESKFAKAKMEEMRAANEEMARKLKETEALRAGEEEARKLAELERDAAKAKAKVTGRVGAIVRKVGKTIEERANASREALRGKLLSLSPEDLVHIVNIAADNLFKLGENVAKWTARMVEEFGENIKPHLDEILKAAREELDVRAEDAQKTEEAKKAEAELKAQADKAESAARAARTAEEKAKRAAERVRASEEAKANRLVKERNREETAAEKLDAEDAKKANREAEKEQEAARAEEKRAKEKANQAANRVVRERNRAEKAGEVEEARLARQAMARSEEGRLDAYKRTLGKRLEQVEKQRDELIRTGRIERKTRTPPPIDRKVIELQASIEKVKSDIKAEEARLLARKLPTWAKVVNALANWKRGLVLTSLNIFEKLTAAGLYRQLKMPIEDLMGAALSKLPGIRQLSERAKIEGGTLGSIQQEAKTFVEGWTTGLKDAKERLLHGEATLDIAHGHRRPNLESESAFEPRFLQYAGWIHFALKSPTFRNAYERALYKIRVWESSRGIDGSNEITKLRQSNEAYEWAKRQVSMQDNFFVDRYNRALRSLSEVDKSTGKPKSAVGTVLAAAAREEMPIVKVPSNLAGETIDYLFGAVTGSVKLGKALRAGIEKLPTDQADAILRSLKKGSLGLPAAVLIGYFLRDSIGGFFLPGESRKQREVHAKAGTVRIGDYEVSETDLHDPLIGAIMFGATVGRAADAKIRKTDADPQGLWNGLASAALGLSETTSWGRELVDLSKLREPAEREKILGQRVASAVVPGALGSIARGMDKEGGVPVRRNPRNVVERVEMNIPGLRGNVPVAHAGRRR